MRLQKFSHLPDETVLQFNKCMVTPAHVLKKRKKGPNLIECHLLLGSIYGEPKLLN